METTVFQVTEVGSVMDTTQVDYDIKEMKDGKVVKRHRFSHKIGTKTNGESEKFAPIMHKAKPETPPGAEQRPDAIKMNEVFVGNQQGEPAPSEKQE
jgi:hypothetical protein